MRKRRMAFLNEKGIQPAPSILAGKYLVAIKSNKCLR